VTPLTEGSTPHVAIPTDAAPPSFSRARRIAAGATLLAAAPATATPAGSKDRIALPGYVFTLGVASGDPAPDSVVRWTRLAPDPLALDGLGGMPDRAVNVRWEMAEDEAFRRIARRGVTRATAEWAHSVHVDVHGLRPDRVYWYRFRIADQDAPMDVKGVRAVKSASRAVCTSRTM
jgi:alkaline phosphatase D